MASFFADNFMLAFRALRPPTNESWLDGDDNRYGGRDRLHFAVLRML